MGLSLYVVLGSAVVGLLVGLTGAGGGALMTADAHPAVLGSSRPAAISSDLVRRGRDAARRRRRSPAQGHGEPAHGRADDASARCRWRSSASFLLRQIGRQCLRPERRSRSRWARRCWSGRRPWCCANVLDRRSRAGAHGRDPGGSPCGRLPTRADRHGRRADRRHHLGRLGLADDHPAAVHLPACCPRARLVGTDLTQAVPPHRGGGRWARWTFGHVEFGVTASIIVGSVPRGADRLAPILPGAGQVHQAGHHLRDLRVRAEVRSACRPTRWASSWAASCWRAGRTGWPCCGPRRLSRSAGSPLRHSPPAAVPEAAGRSAGTGGKRRWDDVADQVTGQVTG